MRFFGKLCGLAVMLFLVGCANSGSMSMRFQVGPDLGDPDFDESLALFRQQASKAKYPWGDVKFAPEAQLRRIGGGAGWLNVQRILVMDGGFILVSHNMIDDQFYSIVAITYENLSDFSMDAEDIASGSKRQDVKFSAAVEGGSKAVFDGMIVEPEASALLDFVSAKLEEK